ncbi:MAG: hypothetical protein ACRDMH_01170 [Solirubrobacterales bacterium]
MFRRLAILGAGGVLIVSVLAVITIGSATGDSGRAEKAHGYYHRALVGAHGRFIKADGPLPDSCIAPRHGQFVCDGVGVLLTRPRPFLPVRASSRVSMQFFHNRRLRDRPHRVIAYLLRFHRHRSPGSGIAALEAHRTVGHWHWRFRLPHNLHGGNVLSIKTRLQRGGQAHYFVGLKPG